MLRTFHPGCRKSVTEFDAPHTGNREYGMCDQRFHRIKKRFTESGRKPGDDTFHNPSKRISFCNGLIEFRSP